MGEFYKYIFKLMLCIDIMSTCEIGLRWMSQNTFDDKSTLDEVMAWCRQVPSHYFTQCWPRSMSLYVDVRPQRVKAMMRLFFTELLNTVDYVWNDGTVVFRTCPQEAGKVVFQIVSGNWAQSSCSCWQGMVMGHVTLVVITRTTILVPYL